MFDDRKKAIVAKSVYLLISILLLSLIQTVQLHAVTVTRIDDQANLLQKSELLELSEELDRISERYQCDIVIVVVEDIASKTPTEFADDYYDNHSYGLGGDSSGMLFLLSMAERDWAISTHGEAIKIFDDSTQERLMKRIIPDLRRNDMVAAFNSLVDFSEMTLDNYASSGIAKNSRPAMFYILPFLIGIALTALIMRGLKAPLTSVGFRSGASSYLIDDSMSIANAKDYFLYSSIARVAIPKNTGSSSGGGYSSTHTSSSGRTHGGSSGKF